MEIAFRYRDYFRKDIIVDLLVYRRWGCVISLIAQYLAYTNVTTQTQRVRSSRYHQPFDVREDCRSQVRPSAIRREAFGLFYFTLTRQCTL